MPITAGLPEPDPVFRDKMDVPFGAEPAPQGLFIPTADNGNGVFMIFAEPGKNIVQLLVGFGVFGIFLESRQGTVVIQEKDPFIRFLVLVGDRFHPVGGYFARKRRALTLYYVFQAVNKC